MSRIITILLCNAIFLGQLLISGSTPGWFSHVVDRSIQSTTRNNSCLPSFTNKTRQSSQDIEKTSCCNTTSNCCCSGGSCADSMSPDIESKPTTESRKSIVRNQTCNSVGNLKNATIVSTSGQREEPRKRSISRRLPSLRCVLKDESSQLQRFNPSFLRYTSISLFLRNCSFLC